MNEKITSGSLPPLKNHPTLTPLRSDLFAVVAFLIGDTEPEPGDVSPGKNVETR